jgi:hypothetical protein
MLLKSVKRLSKRWRSDEDGLKALLAKPHRKHTLFGSGEFEFF